MMKRHFVDLMINAGNFYAILYQIAQAFIKDVARYGENTLEIYL